MRDQELIDLHEAYASIYASQDIEEVYKGKHGQSEKEYQDDRSDAGKRISGDSRTGPRYYTLGRSRGATADEPTEPGKKPKNTPKLSKSEKDEIKYRRANLRKEEFETWVNDLVEEGYDLSGYTWEEMYEIYTEEVEQIDEDKAYDRNRRRAAQRAAARNEARRQGKTGSVPGVGYVSPRPERETYTDSEGAVRHHTGGRMPKNEETDLFDYILEYLVAEGYADTNENAIVIMANMSEDWRESIVEEMLDEEITSEKGKAKAAEMIAKRTHASGRAKSGQGDNVEQIRHIQRSNREGLLGTPPNRKTAGSNWPKSYSGIGGSGNKAEKRKEKLKKKEN